MNWIYLCVQSKQQGNNKQQTWFLNIDTHTFRCFLLLCFVSFCLHYSAHICDLTFACIECFDDKKSIWSLCIWRGHFAIFFFRFCGFVIVVILLTFSLVYFENYCRKKNEYPAAKTTKNCRPFAAYWAWLNLLKSMIKISSSTQTKKNTSRNFIISLKNVEMLSNVKSKPLPLYVHTAYTLRSYHTRAKIMRQMCGDGAVYERAIYLRLDFLLKSTFSRAHTLSQRSVCCSIFYCCCPCSLTPHACAQQLRIKHFTRVTLTLPLTIPM